MQQSSNRSIARNTLFLYGRKIVTLIIALYTSRLLLQKLGVDDFGIYGLVGSVVAMFSALRSIFSTSIQRYINIAKGKADAGEVQKIFSLGLKIHRLIALLFLIVGEIGGLIMIHYLNLPNGTFGIANWVFQFSLLTAIVTVLTVPYDALIIANERFDAYAIFSIIDSILKLSVVLLLVFSPVNRMVFYALLLLLEAIVIRSMNALYCRYQFQEESKYIVVRDRQLLKEMTHFAGWQFLGNTAYTLSNNGINFILNIMGGVVVNAARTIAYQVMSAVSQFIGDINLSFQPRTMRTYAEGNHKDFMSLIYLNTKANFTISAILAFPIFILAGPILAFWLGEAPEYSESFVKLLMVYMLIRSLHAPLDLYFKSYGNLKRYQLVELVVLLLNLPLSWLALSLKFPFYSVFAVMIMCEIINTVSIIILAKKQYNFKITHYLSNVGYRVIIAFLLLAICAIGVPQIEGFHHTSIIGLILNIIALIILSSVISIVTLFKPSEIKGVFNFLKRS